MENDDVPVGALLSRREALALLSSASVAFLAACVRLPGSEASSTGTVQPTFVGVTPTTTTSTAAGRATSLPICVVRPEQTEGPYFVDEMLLRSDIRSDPATGAVTEGLPLTLNFVVTQINNSCAPLAGATVDVWHCDAQGVYSDVRDPGFDTSGQKFLRGTQVTDADGLAQFTTIYPGWYQGRTVHIHFKIRTNPESQTGYEFTSQLYFDDALTDVVHAQEPYASKGVRTLRNAGDRIFQDGGEQLTLDASENGSGFDATFVIGLQLA